MSKAKASQEEKEPEEQEEKQEEKQDKKQKKKKEEEKVIPAFVSVEKEFSLAKTRDVPRITLKEVEKIRDSLYHELDKTMEGEKVKDIIQKQKDQLKKQTRAMTFLIHESNILQEEAKADKQAVATSIETLKTAGLIGLGMRRSFSEPKKKKELSNSVVVGVMLAVVLAIVGVIFALLMKNPAPV